MPQLYSQDSTEKTTLTYSTFQPGDTVWCVLFGQGRVTKIDPESAYQVRVRFKDDDCWYTADGKLHATMATRTLFFSPPVVTGETRRP